MAQRRMFNVQIIDSDAFIGMPATTQNLYFHLCMRADDDGFISGPRKIQRMIGASDDDMKLLLAKRFILAFDSGIVVVKHWRIHNYIQKDRYHETLYKEEKATLFMKPDGAYTDHPVLPTEVTKTPELPEKSEENDGVYNVETECIHDVDNTRTQVRLEIGKSNNISSSNEEDCPKRISDARPDEKKSKKKEPISHEHNAYKAAKWLSKQIRKRMPDRKEYTEDDLQRWAEDIDKVHRIDGYDWDLISDILQFSQRSTFWQANILSGAKFRKQFETLMAQEARDGND